MIWIVMKSQSVRSDHQTNWDFDSFDGTLAHAASVDDTLKDSKWIGQEKLKEARRFCVMVGLRVCQREHSEGLFDEHVKVWEIIDCIVIWLDLRNQLKLTNL